MSVTVTTVLLKVALMWKMPRATFFLTFFLAEPLRLFFSSLVLEGDSDLPKEAFKAELKCRREEVKGDKMEFLLGRSRAFLVTGFGVEVISEVNSGVAPSTGAAFSSVFVLLVPMWDLVWEMAMVQRLGTQTVMSSVKVWLVNS